MTLGLEHDLFTVNLPDSAANFQAVKKKIAIWVGTSSWKGAARASQVIETLVEPVFVKLDPPVSPLLSEASDPNPSQDKVALLAYSIEVAEHIENAKELRRKKREYEEIAPKIWNLLLSHCPPETCLRLEAQPNWESNQLSREPVELGKTICALSQSFDVTKNEMMAIVDADVTLMLKYQGKTASIDDFLRLFRSRIDTIESHGGTPGYHPGQVDRVLARELAAVNMDDTAWDALDAEAKKKLRDEATKMARAEYLACLFVRQTCTHRYGELKKLIMNDGLRTGQEYPKTVEAAAMLFKHYIPTAEEKLAQTRATAAAAAKTAGVAPPSGSNDVAFV